MKHRSAKGLGRLARLVGLAPSVALTGMARAQTPFCFSADGKDFLLHGAPFQIRSGELHPARIPREYWTHRIRMAKAMGMNTIAIYVMWNYHETQAGIFDFHSENRDIEAFIRLCQEEQLWVLLRPGPYVCAEWDLGGLPPWLLAIPDIRLRTDSRTDPRYMEAVSRYIAELAPRVAPLIASRGGPILMIQIENEFGSYACNPAYLEEICALWRQNGIEGPFYTEDGIAQLQQNRSNVAGGAIALSNGNAQQIALAREAWPGVPVMAGEVYPGWLTHWGEPAMQGTSVDLSAVLHAFMRQKQSFNLYVIHGGTSFGFYAGANVDPQTGDYQPDITSYDYAAPISEQGVATAKFHVYRRIIESYVPATPPLAAIPAPLPTLCRSGHDALRPVHWASLWENLPAPLALAAGNVALPFEYYGLSYGFALYRTRLEGYVGGTLSIEALHDYATVFVDGRYAGALTRARVPPEYARNMGVAQGGTLVLPPATADSREADGSVLLEILVEGMGRVNYGPDLVDRKGIVGEVALLDRASVRHVLSDWEVTLLPMDRDYIMQLQNATTAHESTEKAGRFYRATLTVEAVADTYLDMQHWTNGLVWVNGHALGRYWRIGPQQRLFCPAPWLVSGDNTITIFDLHQQAPMPVALEHTLA
ncbi:beta-galactosidase [Paraburkholderia sp. J12]|uniref:beta-galactosidase n=1 Tax=Paraburkholderia sp. J12 TaxID=2805432 RepID=UPI002ABDF7FD|nr:beta-galactosidase [Paraburkholderia sp. J12]